MNSIITASGIQLWSKYDLSNIEGEGSLQAAVKVNDLPSQADQNGDVWCTICGSTFTKHGKTDTICALDPFGRWHQHPINVKTCTSCGCVIGTLALYIPDSCFGPLERFRYATRWVSVWNGLSSMQHIGDEPDDIDVI